MDGEKSAGLPPRPKPPLEGECCGRGCERCVWVYYEEALRRWERLVAAQDPADGGTVAK